LRLTPILPFLHLCLHLCLSHLQVTGELGGASALEVTRFFLVLMRQLNRTLCGGTCVYSRSRANPYAHTSSRCQAFLALLQVFGKVAPEVKHILCQDVTFFSHLSSQAVKRKPLLPQLTLTLFLLFLRPRCTRTRKRGVDPGLRNCCCKPMWSS
jgi:hypothetical protein